MKALILAAGLGSRLRPLTDEVPKCMVKVNGLPIIDRQILNLKENRIKEIYIITGYKEEVLIKHLNEEFNDLDIKIISNKDYDKTNNMYSLNLAKEFLDKTPFIMMNSDVFFEKDVIRGLLNNEYDNLIVCEKGNHNDESMKIVVEDEIINHISKKVSKEDGYGTSIDVYKFGKEASEKLFEITNGYLFVKKDLNSWSEVAIDDLLKLCKFKSLDTTCKWMEIDNHDDLKIAEKIFE